MCACKRLRREAARLVHSESEVEDAEAVDEGRDATATLVSRAWSPPTNYTLSHMLARQSSPPPAQGEPQWVRDKGREALAIWADLQASVFCLSVTCGICRIKYLV